MTTILFWNINKKPLLEEIVYLLQDKEHVYECIRVAQIIEEAETRVWHDHQGYFILDLDNESTRFKL